MMKINVTVHAIPFLKDKFSIKEGKKDRTGSLS